jgi:hypothetical protein
VSGNVTRAAEAAGVSRRAPYDWRADDASFAEAWDEALEAACDALEAEARRRAYEGWEEPVYQKGALVGRIRKYSDRLLEVLLRAHRPEKYRETVRIRSGRSVPGLRFWSDRAIP